jgi:hypothetical protein
MSLPNLLAPFVVPMRSSTYLLLLLYGNIETIMSRTLSVTTRIWQS